MAKGIEELEAFLAPGLNSSSIEPVIKTSRVLVTYFGDHTHW